MSAASAAPASELVRRDEDDGVVTLTLATPQNRNALGLAMIDTLIVGFAEIAKDEKARVIVLTGEGPALSGGHNLREMQAHRNDPDRGHDYYEHLMARCSVLMQAIVALPKPVIAAVEGIATAAGCQLVATCDLAVAAESAAFAIPGGKGGLFCHTPLVAVARNLGRKRALQMALTGDPIDAATALDWGLVNEVVPDDALVAATADLLRRATRGSAASKGLGKLGFYAQIGLPQDEAYAFAIQQMAEAALLPDAQEAFAAFLDKRQPVFTSSPADAVVTPTP
jgi:enoyl-CoA hydratase/carnithine racemase